MLLNMLVLLDSILQMQLFQINQSEDNSKITIMSDTTCVQLHQRPITSSSNYISVQLQPHRIQTCIRHGRFRVPIRRLCLRCSKMLMNQQKWCHETRLEKALKSDSRRTQDWTLEEALRSDSRRPRDQTPGGFDLSLKSNVGRVWVLGRDFVTNPAHCSEINYEWPLTHCHWGS